MENQNDIPFIIKDNNGHTIPSSSFEDKHFVGLSHGSYSVNFSSSDFGLFISHRNKEKEINQFIIPTKGEVFHFEIYTSGIFIFIPLNYLNSDIKFASQHNIKYSYSLVITKIRDSLSIDDYKRTVELKGIVSLVMISLIENDSSSIIDRVIDLIKQNITNEDLSLEAISKKLFMSKRKLQYLFASNQTTYKKTLNKVKVELAVMHLHENPNLSIKKLLSMSGFNSHSSASIAFKKEMGVGLSEYKRQISNVS